jgi:hypothetical protein
MGFIKATACLVAIFLTGCVTDGFTEAERTRIRAYKRTLRGVAPGMTRQQLYTLLPPAKKPQVQVAAGEILEMYPLDPGLYLSVRYTPAKPREYDGAIRAWQKKRRTGGFPNPYPTAPSHENPRDVIVEIRGPLLRTSFPAWAGPYLVVANSVNSLPP